MLKFRDKLPGGKDIIKKEKIKTIKYYIKNRQNFKLKENYDSIIPLDVYTCWHTKDLPPLMKQNYEKLISDNPEMNFHLYDENECREFIKIHFHMYVLAAYDGLIPCAYKADLWRYCVLYINGGVYIDIKYSCTNGFKFIALTEKEHFVRDRPENCIYNALIVCKPRNLILFNCIHHIVNNVKNKFYGKDVLSPTGPRLLGLFFSKKERKQMEMYFENSTANGRDNYYIGYNNGITDIIILKIYDEYRAEQSQYQKKSYYANLWNEKKIYK